MQQRESKLTCPTLLPLWLVIMSSMVKFIQNHEIDNLELLYHPTCTFKKPKPKTQPSNAWPFPLAGCLAYSGFCISGF